MSTKDPTDYEAMAKDMMQQWQDSWKTMLQNSPSTQAASGSETAQADKKSEQKPAEEAPDIMTSWQNMMQPALAAQQQLFSQFWQQMAGSAETPPAQDNKGAPDDAPHAARAAAAAPRTEPRPEPVRAESVQQPQPASAAAAAPAAAPPHAGADGNADLARRIDLLSQRLLRCEVELDKLKRANAAE